MEHLVNSKGILKKQTLTSFIYSNDLGECTVERVYLGGNVNLPLTYFDDIKEPVKIIKANDNSIHIKANVTLKYLGDLMSIHSDSNASSIKYFLPNKKYFLHPMRKMNFWRISDNDGAISQLPLTQVIITCGRKMLELDDWTPALSAVPCVPVEAYNNDGSSIIEFKMGVNAGLHLWRRDYFKEQPVVPRGMYDVSRVVDSSYSCTLTSIDGNNYVIDQLYIVDRTGLTRVISSDVLSSKCEVIYSDAYKTVIYDKAYWSLSRPVNTKPMSPTDKLHNPIHQLLENKVTPELVRGTHNLLLYGDYYLVGHKDLGFKYIHKSNFNMYKDTKDLIETRVYLANLYMYEPNTDTYTFTKIRAVIGEAAEILHDLLGLESDADAVELATLLYTFGSLTVYRNWNSMYKSWLIDEICDLIYYMLTSTDYFKPELVSCFKKIVKLICSEECYNYLRKYVKPNGYAGEKVTFVYYTAQSKTFECRTETGRILGTVI